MFWFFIGFLAGGGGANGGNNTQAYHQPSKQEMLKRSQDIVCPKWQFKVCSTANDVPFCKCEN